MGAMSAVEVEPAVMQGAEIILCTIASTSRLLREWEERTGEQLTVHTAIVDECGCTAESSMGMLLRLRPRNLILVGDHKQLPPVSMCPPSMLQGTGHTRSLLERCILASGRVHKLREQYRMHPAISNLVSSMFYAGGLTTPTAVAEERALGAGTPPIVWLGPEGTSVGEEVGPGGRSFVNYAEAQAVVGVARRLRSLYPTGSIAVITMYKGQLLELMRTMPASLGVEVLTVDSCQGSEFEYVIVSPVRSNYTGRIGFLGDKQRICVALSRCMRRLFLVGDDKTLGAKNADWSRVVQEAAFAPLQDWWEGGKAAAGAGGEVSLLDALKSSVAAASAEAEAAAVASRGHDPDSAVRLMRGQASFSAPPGRKQGRGGGQEKGGGGKGVVRQSIARAGGGKARSGGSTEGDRPTCSLGYTPALTDPSSFPSLPAKSTEEEAFQREIDAAMAESQAMAPPPAPLPVRSADGWAVDRVSLHVIFPDSSLIDDVLARFIDMGMEEDEAVQRGFVVLSEMSEEGEAGEVDDFEWDYRGGGEEEEEEAGEGEEEGEETFWREEEAEGEEEEEGEEDEEREQEEEAGPPPASLQQVPQRVPPGIHTAASRTTRYGAVASPGTSSLPAGKDFDSYQEQETAMAEMGFQDPTAVRAALSRCNGDVAAAIEWLYNQPSPDGREEAPLVVQASNSLQQAEDPGELLRHGLEAQGLIEISDVSGYVLSVLESLEEDQVEGRADTMHALVQLLVAEGVLVAPAEELLAACAAAMAAQ